MAYNRWLAHHGVKGQKWGEKNGPPYPLDSSKSNGHKLLSGSGSPQGKKKYKTSEKTSHQRAERKARTNNRSDEEILKSFQRTDSYGGMYNKKLSNGSSKPVTVFMFDDPPEQMKKKLEIVREIEREIPKIEKHVKSAAYDKDVKDLLSWWSERDVSKEEFNKDFHLTNVFVTESGVELTFFDDGKYFGYHDLCVEYDPKTKRISYSSLQG